MAAAPNDISDSRLKAIMDTIEFSSDEDLRTIWNDKLSLAEKTDPRIVYKILSTNSLFGSNPWEESPYYWELVIDLPAGFKSDPDAFLAFISSPDFERNWSDNRKFWVPEVVRDNRDVMLALCEKNSYCLESASCRLKDDEAVVRSAVLKSRGSGNERHRKCYHSHEMIRHASNRLRGDRQLICDLIEDCGSDIFWIRDTILDELNVQELKHILSRVSSRLPTYFLKYFPAAVRDNKQAMLPFVEREGSALEYCSDRLRRDKEVVHSAVKNYADAWEYALGPVRSEYDAGRTVTSVLAEITKEKLSFSHVPEAMQSNPAVVKAAMDAGQLWFSDLTETMVNDKHIILDYIRHGDLLEDEFSYVDDLPEPIQMDEEVAIAVLETGYYMYEEIFRKLPSLCHSRKAMEAIITKTRKLDHPCEFPSEYVRQCPFRDDAEFMLAAYENDDDTLQHASSRLLSNRDFMVAASGLGCVSITYAPPEFQVNNLDLVVIAIENCARFDIHEQWLFDNLAYDVWYHRGPVMAWLEVGYPILESLAFFSHGGNPFLSDREVVSLSVKLRASELGYASLELKADRTFILQLVSETERVLHFAAKKLRYDEEILVAALAKNGGTVVDCFDIVDSVRYKKFLSWFAAKLRAGVELHECFVRDFLRGISTCDQSQVAHGRRCQLPLLDQGPDTSIAFKRLIAEFLGVPLGAEFHRRTAALAALETFGF